MQWDLTTLFTNLCVLLKRIVALNQLSLKDFGKVIEKWGEVPLELLGPLVFIGCAEQRMQPSSQTRFINAYSLPRQAWHVVVGSAIGFLGLYLAVVFNDGGRYAHVIALGGAIQTKRGTNFSHRVPVPRLSCGKVKLLQ